MKYQPAPELQISHWLNTETDLTLERLKGRVILIEAFQMLCPGCVSHGLPQAQRVADNFTRDDVVVLGLHTVFEHHDAQGSRAALAAFLHEYRISFPVAIDAPASDGHIPQTMATYGLRGTPSLILIDRDGYIRKKSFGRETDLLLGADIMALVLDNKQAKTAFATDVADDAEQKQSDCDDTSCPAS